MVLSRRQMGRRQILEAKSMSFSAVGDVFDIPGFRAHVAGLDLSWADSVCLHHTASPDLSMRPKGWTIQHMRNLAHFYGVELGWSSGPHLFTDEDQIFGLSPLTSRGVHARSFNARSIGIEALGDYDNEDPGTGRGVEVWEMTFQATAVLLDRLGLEATTETVLFHRDDPKTWKTCPGRKISKEWALDCVRAYLDDLRGLNDRTDDEPPTGEPDDVLAAIRNHSEKIIELTN